MENESDDIIREMQSYMWEGESKKVTMLLNAFANMSNKSAMLYIVGFW